ncbi:hypothetical protein VTJ04DRAFT_2251 [Mycothermus thermophilus]|uniref:uncharacterized protein n=1 Tax=Humicola insolens TaxID=85995 RepID=UPI0037423C1F
MPYIQDRHRRRTRSIVDRITEILREPDPYDSPSPSRSNASRSPRPGSVDHTPRTQESSTTASGPLVRRRPEDMQPVRLPSNSDDNNEEASTSSRTNQPRNAGSNGNNNSDSNIHTSLNQPTRPYQRASYYTITGSPVTGSPRARDPSHARSPTVDRDADDDGYVSPYEELFGPTPRVIIHHHDLRPRTHRPHQHHRGHPADHRRHGPPGFPIHGAPGPGSGRVMVVVRPDYSSDEDSDSDDSVLASPGMFRSFCPCPRGDPRCPVHCR